MSSSEGETEAAIQVHKLKTRLNSLLQDRKYECRWTAVVLVKAYVEAGQWEALRGCEPLVRSMIGILKVCMDSVIIDVTLVSVLSPKRKIQVC